MTSCALAVVQISLASSAIAADRLPLLTETALYREIARGCSDVDLATWKHPTKNVFEREATPIQRVQLCNSRLYPIFFTELRADPHVSYNDEYTNKVIGEVFEANGHNPFAIVAKSYGVVIEVKVQGRRSLFYWLEDFKQ